MPTQAELIEAAERVALRDAIAAIVDPAGGLPELKAGLGLIMSRLVKNGHLPKSADAWEL